jgi:hypothetical protein
MSLKKNARQGNWGEYNRATPVTEGLSLLARDAETAALRVSSEPKISPRKRRCKRRIPITALAAPYEVASFAWGYLESPGPC